MVSTPVECSRFAAVLALPMPNLEPESYSF